MVGIGTSFQDSRRRDWVARRLRPSAVALCYGQTSVARVFRGPCEGDCERILPSRLPREAAEHYVKNVSGTLLTFVGMTFCAWNLAVYMGVLVSAYMKRS
jgi:hypothetical protein